MTDERSAGFFALGLALHGGTPAAVCCTSGTALLNLHPAVAEAFYQKVPLLVISADRPAAWIGQMDGQTLPQPGVFGTLVKKSVNLPIVNNKEEYWYSNRLINEAILELDHRGKGPVHINVPIDEPFLHAPETNLPKERVITRYQGLNVYDKDYQPLIERLNKYQKRMVVVGQMNLIYLFEKRYVKMLHKHFTWVAENLSNGTVPGMALKNIDMMLSQMDEEDKQRLRPDLLITYGGHIISKRLKIFLRNHPPKEHWHISPDGEVMDVYKALTTVIEMDPFEFLEKIAPMLEGPTPEYPRLWEARSKATEEVQFGYSEMWVIMRVLRELPTPCVLHLGNSLAVRYAQLFKLPEGVEVLCNRGTNGIEGTVSTAMGYSVVSDKLNYIIVGDLSFFYDMNALWNCNYGSNLRILVLNNHGGGIFHRLKLLEMTDATRRFIRGTHYASVKGWAEDRGFCYMSAHNDYTLTDTLKSFLYPSILEKPIMLEVFLDSKIDADIYNFFIKK